MTKRSATSGKLDRPDSGRKRWTSFIAEDTTPGKVVTDPHEQGKVVRGLHEQANPRHRLRVEHDAYTLLVHLSDEDGDGWTTFAVDRETRQWAAAQAPRQTDAARHAYDSLYDQK